MPYELRELVMDREAWRAAIHLSLPMKMVGNTVTPVAGAAGGVCAAPIPVMMTNHQKSFSGVKIHEPHLTMRTAGMMCFMCGMQSCPEHPPRQQCSVEDRYQS